ncbi:App1 family protein [Flavobacterium branchiarum]|uniref:App1 family protein n=1 Tax=Flavobacterium branchiarum TaxID=1114870 RepID=A0ABV5FLY0_9FLAO|nr:App1 family protein [Flavobacterium branchiarum]MDN3674611.1 App1 family protein [Flavobacterium branchiarum]
MKPILKLYRGYANDQELIVMGHVFKPSTASDYDFQKKNFKNASSILKLFRIKTIPNYDVYLKHGNRQIHTKTLDDGFFKFCIPLYQKTDFGWIDYEVSITHKSETITSFASFIRPHDGNLGIISDIDDTFLISHTKSFFRKLYILLFRNVNDRKIFDDVVPHYQALSSAGRNNKNEKNAFFYISSSEWNLYRFIIRFTKIHDLPRAVILLKDIKTGISDFFMSGRGSHNHKFEKIKHVLEFYPNLKYVLLGDDSQHDPMLYENICKIFPVTVKAVYIRQTGKNKKEATKAILKNLENLEVSICYFKDSSEAIEHSKKIGIIT